jgi:hypothetical protein
MSVVTIKEQKPTKKIIIIVLLILVYYAINTYILKTPVNVTTEVVSFIGKSLFSVAMQNLPLLIL